MLNSKRVAMQDKQHKNEAPTKQHGHAADDELDLVLARLSATNSNKTLHADL